MMICNALSSVKPLVITTCLLAGSGAAFATTCTVDGGAAAYVRAKARGWIFHCTRAVLDVDRDGRIGCVARTGPGKRLRGSVDFFQNGETAFNQGWQLTGFTLSGQGWQPPLPPTRDLGLVQAAFAVEGAWASERFTLLSLTLRKPQGDCARVIREAF